MYSVSPSWASITTAPGCAMYSRLTSSPSSWRKVSTRTVAIIPSYTVSPPVRSKATEALYPAAAWTMPSFTSSIVSSAHSVTDSSGWWLRSVPLATFSTGRPAAMNAFASLPPPVVM